MRENFRDSSGEWNYYNDGKRWLFKMIRKKKTIFWIGILEDTFRVTFYFGDKAEPIIEQSDLPESIKTNFKNAKRFNTTRGISIDMTNKDDVINAIKLIELRLKTI